MKKILTSLMIVMFLANMGFANNKQNILMDGSTTVLPIAQATAEEFMNKNPKVNITVKGGGSGVGIASLIDKTCDIANSSRAIKETEITKAVANGVDPVAHIVAMDGIAVIVNPSNPLDELSKQTLMNIYTGKITFWSQVPNYKGKGGAIVVLSRDTASGTYEAFNTLALGGRKVRKDALLNASNRAILSTVVNTPGAIGYVGLGYVNNTVKALKIDGIECNAQNVLKGTYALARPLFMYTNGKPKGAVADYLNYVLGVDGQKLVEEAGFVKLA